MSRAIIIYLGYAKEHKTSRDEHNKRTIHILIRGWRILLAEVPPLLMTCKGMLMIELETRKITRPWHHRASYFRISSQRASTIFFYVYCTIGARWCEINSFCIFEELLEAVLFKLSYMFDVSYTRLIIHEELTRVVPQANAMINHTISRTLKEYPFAICIFYTFLISKWAKIVLFDNNHAISSLYPKIGVSSK